jgi:hypothetical protein
MILHCQILNVSELFVTCPDLCNPRDCVINERSLCTGDPEEVVSCNASPCPSLTDWSEWTECSKSCGKGGAQRRVRDCLVQRSGIGNACFEPLEESQGCNSQDCPFWTEWSEWTDCSRDCGSGDRSKVRATFLKLCSLSLLCLQTQSRKRDT